LLAGSDRAADQRHRHVVDHADVLEVVQRLVRQVAVQRRLVAMPMWCSKKV
jgi:hypothetical protein